jgi:hypothetical protein
MKRALLDGRDQHELIRPGEQEDTIRNSNRLILSPSSVNFFSQCSNLLNLEATISQSGGRPGTLRRSEQKSAGRIPAIHESSGFYPRSPLRFVAKVVKAALHNEVASPLSAIDIARRRVSDVRPRIFSVMGMP